MLFTIYLILLTSIASASVSDQISNVLSPKINIEDASRTITAAKLNEKHLYLSDIRSAAGKFESRKLNCYTIPTFYFDRLRWVIQFAMKGVSDTPKDPTYCEVFGKKYYGKSFSQDLTFNKFPFLKIPLITESCTNIDVLTYDMMEFKGDGFKRLNNLINQQRITSTYKMSLPIVDGTEKIFVDTCCSYFMSTTSRQHIPKLICNPLETDPPQTLISNKKYQCYKLLRTLNADNSFSFPLILLAGYYSSFDSNTFSEIEKKKSKSKILIDELNMMLDEIKSTATNGKYVSCRFIGYIIEDYYQGAIMSKIKDVRLFKRFNLINRIIVGLFGAAEGIHPIGDLVVKSVKLISGIVSALIKSKESVVANEYEIKFIMYKIIKQLIKVDSVSDVGCMEGSRLLISSVGKAIEDFNKHQNSIFDCKPELSGVDTDSWKGLSELYIVSTGDKLSDIPEIKIPDEIDYTEIIDKTIDNVKSLVSGGVNFKNNMIEYQLKEIDDAKKEQSVTRNKFSLEAENLEFRIQKKNYTDKLNLFNEEVRLLNLTI